MNSKSFQSLVGQLKQLPSVGNKTARRYALHLLSMDEESLKQFTESILKAKENIHPCSQCGQLTEDECCDICRDQTRDRSIICVVEQSTDIEVIEKSQAFNGIYHVLGGLISPMNQIMPKDLTIDSLKQRVDSSIQEVILALSPTIEGETTSLYLTKLFQDQTKVTVLAMGIPMGSSIEYVDEVTLSRSFSSRKTYQY